MGIMVSVSRRKTRKNPTNPLLSPEAIDTALDALEELGGEHVGEYIGAELVGDVAVHRFRSLAPGYSKWEWTAVLAHVPGSGTITVNDIALQAGKGAALAPDWVPYEDRVRPGDLGPGDSLPPRADDDRLAAAEEITADDGFPRNPHAPRALSQSGLSSALQRWRTGDFGPNSEFAEKAPMMCRTCAFYLPINSTTTRFGVCANEFSADGRVVHATYGCGAHSETKESGNPAASRSRSYGAFDDEGIRHFGRL